MSSMECLYFKGTCEITEVLGNLTNSELAAFCSCCITKKDSDRLNEELKVNRMNLIANLLASFPNNKGKAKEAYQMLERFVDEWQVVK